MSTTTMDPEVIHAPTIDVSDLEAQFNPYEDDGNSTHKSHYVSPADNIAFQMKYGRFNSGQALVDTARLLGEEVVALCGFRWVPKANPAKFPVCEACAKIAGDILLGED